MATTEDRRVPILLWPFWVVWRLLATILGVTGRLLGIVLGLVLMTVGIVLAATVVGGVVGIPLIALGFLLLLRALF